MINYSLLYISTLIFFQDPIQTGPDGNQQLNGQGIPGYGMQDPTGEVISDDVRPVTSLNSFRKRLKYCRL